MIDYIITNRTILLVRRLSMIFDVRVLTSANIGTDHNLVLCKIMVGRPTKLKKEAEYMEKYNIESLETDTNTRILYEERLTNKLSKIDLIECDVENCWIKLKNCIKEAITEAIEKRKINLNATNHTKLWFCQEIKALTKLKKKSFLTYKSLHLRNNIINMWKSETG